MIIQRKNIQKLIITVVFFIIFICFSNKVNATSISFTPNNPKVGDEVKVTISVANVNTVSISANISGVASGTIKLVDGSLSGQPSNYSKTETFKCLREGSLNVSISPDSTAVLNGEYVNVVTSASVNISPNNRTSNNGTSDNNSNENNNNNSSNNTETPATTQTKSNNANLKNLGIKPNDFKGFKFGTTTYNVTVPNDVEQVNVYATAQDSKASITGTGNQKLNVGSNKLDVIVTAEDGTKKTYTINVTRGEANNENQENTTSNEQENTTTEQENITTEETNQTTENLIENDTNTSNSDLKKLSISGYTLAPSFSPDIYSYSVNVNTDKTSLDIVTEGANNNVNIDIVGNEDLKDGENIITILVYNEETKQNSTYQIMVNKTNVDLDSLNTTIDDAVNKANRMRIILLGIVFFIVLCIIIFAIVKHKYNSNNKDEWYEYDDADKAKFDTKNTKDDEELQGDDNMYEDNEFLDEEIKQDTLNEEKSNITNVADSIFKDDINEIPKGLQEQPREDYEDRFRKTKRKGKHF